MISKSHSNRNAHNWLAYQIGDRLLQKYTHLYRGILYDLGCGESPYKDYFLHHVDRYVGVDWTGSYHAATAEILADLNKDLPIASDSADTVVSISVLEHLHNPQAMLCEAFRILKPGGWLVLQVPWQWWVHEAPYDFFRYTPFGLSSLFQRAGFVEVVVEPQAGFFSMLVLKLNYFSCRFIRGSRLIRWLTRMTLRPFWYIGQKLAPLLDSLDKDWSLESPGYFVTAKKP